MKGKINKLIEKKNFIKKQKSSWRKIAIILSFVAVLVTIYALALPGITLEGETPYTITLLDSYDYDWKDNFPDRKTSYTLDLYFEDTNGNPITGKNLTIEVGPNEGNYGNYPQSFGYLPADGDSTIGYNILEEAEITTLTSETREKYEFDHAEVYINNEWQQFTEDSLHWDIWCHGSTATTQEQAGNEYGWMGRYSSSNTMYNVTDDVKYKIVYKKVRLGTSDTVPVIGTDSGISFKLFNYFGNNGEVGINNNGVYDYFTFRGMPVDEDKVASGEEAASVIPEMDADGFYNDTRVKVMNNLGEDGYPIYNCVRETEEDNGAEEVKETSQCTNFSLGYLFGSGKNINNATPDGVIEYSPLNTPLQKNENGLYYYDSNLNAVDYDIDNNYFMVRNYVERSYNMTTFIKEPDRYEFLPFNSLGSRDQSYTVAVTDPDTNITTNRVYNYKADEIDHWYGMTMEFTFYMPKGGKLNGQDMIFSFSGDDDVWVFIDNVLVLDLGGTHGAVDGSINFNTGVVESYLNWNGEVGDSEDKRANTTSIYEMYSKAGATDEVLWNEEANGKAANTTFADYEEHTLKFFYLERGASVANCKIRFNMPVLPAGRLSVQKEYLEEEKHEEDYSFIVYDTTNGLPGIPLTNALYTIDNNEYRTDANTGIFTLRTDQIAVFNLINDHTYYVGEVDSGDYSETYSCTLDNSSCTETNISDSFTIGPESNHRVVFTNKIKTYDLTILKDVYDENNNDEFSFKLTMDINKLPEDGEGYNVDRTNGIVTFNLKHNESITINDLEIDTNVILQEVNHDGYTVVVKSADGATIADGDTYEFSMDSNKNIVVNNIPAVVLPETGGPGIIWYLLIGISLIIVSIKFGYKYIFNMKEDKV